MKRLQSIDTENLKKLGMGILIGLSFSLPMSNTLAQGGPQGGPPAEAFTACENLSADEACSVSTPRGDMEGTCKAPPQGEGALACVPKNGRPPAPPRN